MFTRGGMGARHCTPTHFVHGCTMGTSFPEMLRHFRAGMTQGEKSCGFFLRLAAKQPMPELIFWRCNAEGDGVGRAGIREGGRGIVFYVLRGAQNVRWLHSCREKGIMSMKMDGFMSCHENLSAGEVVYTHIEKVDAHHPDLHGWFFDWIAEAKANAGGVYALYADGNTSIQGLISLDKHGASGVEVRLVESATYRKYKSTGYAGIGAFLFAEAVRQSRNAGNQEGFVYFTAKTDLIDYYRTRLGAVRGLGNHMGIYGHSARKLYEEYFGRWDDWKPEK